MAAPDQPPPKSLVDLSDDLLVSIFPCKADRGRMSLVCKAWRDAFDRIKDRVPPPLPWLLLPSPIPDDGSTRAACCVLSGCRIHHHLTITPATARCLGSHDGAWLFLQYGGDYLSHQLLNVVSSDARVLPTELQRWNDPDPVHTMAILAATLSSSPDDADCVAAAIVAAWRYPDPDVLDVAPVPLVLLHRCAAFWRMGSQQAIEIQPDPNPVHHVTDVVYHDGTFRFLLPNGHILLTRPTVGDQAENNLMTNWELLRFHPAGGRLYDDRHVRSSYLVVSREELLLVVRFAPQPNQPRTLAFRVFMATERKAPDDDDDDDDADLFPVAEYPWSWSELRTLGGRMLFVGYGCSRSYDVDQYPGFKEGVYFLDDGKFYDEIMLFSDADLEPYPCSDNGKWLPEVGVQRCFPRPDPSRYSAPAWLLP